MSHCGSGGWGKSIEKEGCVDYRYLAIITGSSISTSITYIVFLTKLQKGESPRKGFALFSQHLVNKL